MDLSLWIGMGILQIVLVIALISAVILVYRNSRKKGMVYLHEELKRVETRFQEEAERMRQRIEQLEDRGNRNTELFKTVLHGFDFIVQGCKKAMTLNEAPIEDPISLSERSSTFLDEVKNETPQEVAEKT
jgi:hypothetical protein